MYIAWKIFSYDKNAGVHLRPDPSPLNELTTSGVRGNSWLKPSGFIHLRAIIAARALITSLGRWIDQWTFSTRDLLD